MRKLPLFASLLLSPFVALANVDTQSVSVETPAAHATASPGFVQSGFRVGVAKPMLETKITQVDAPDTFSYPDAKTPVEIDGSAHSNFAINIGYSNIPLYAVGLLANVSLINLGKGDNSSGVYSAFDFGNIYVSRLELNATYGFNADTIFGTPSHFYAFGGLNAGQYSGSRTLSQMDPMVGFQAGVGFAYYQNWSLDLKYLSTRHEGHVPGPWAYRGDGRIELRGLELGVNYSL